MQFRSIALLVALFMIPALALGAKKESNKGKGKGQGKGNLQRSVLAVGASAPTFTVKDDQGNDWKSADHFGKKIVVVYFYPADMTGGCTKQACGFRDNQDDLIKLGVEVVGVSGDSVENHKIFKEVEKLNFALLADPDGAVAKAFGVPYALGSKSIMRTVNGKQTKLTRTATIQRFTFVVGADGKVAKSYKVANAAGDSKAIIDFVKSLKK